MRGSFTMYIVGTAIPRVSEQAHGELVDSRELPRSDLHGVPQELVLHVRLEQAHGRRDRHLDRLERVEDLARALVGDVRVAAAAVSAVVGQPLTPVVDELAKVERPYIGHM
jgi:hypothetical protein